MAFFYLFGLFIGVVLLLEGTEPTKKTSLKHFFLTLSSISLLGGLLAMIVKDYPPSVTSYKTVKAKNSYTMEVKKGFIVIVPEYSTSRLLTEYEDIVSAKNGEVYVELHPNGDGHIVTKGEVKK